LIRDFIEWARQKLLIWLLKGLRQPWTEQLLNAVNRKVTLPAVELVILRKRNGKIEILLTRRSKKDHYWPFHWGVPGSTPRDYDSTISGILERIWNIELDIWHREKKEINCGRILWEHLRGKCLSDINLYVAELDEEFLNGTFFPVDKLPEPFLGGQEVVINMAVEKFSQLNN